MNSVLKTFILLAGLSAILLVGGQMMAGHTGLMIAIAITLIMNVGSYWFSDKLALMMSGAQEVSRNQAPYLHASVERLSQRAGIPKPRVYMIQSATPNAFATGRNPHHSAVAFTTGIVDMLDQEELDGVIAHELAHIKNRDILISSIAAVLAGAVSSLAQMAMWASAFGRNENGGIGSLIGGMLMMIFAPIAAMLVQMSISRTREYLADETGARICGHSRGLASALVKLEQGNRMLPMRVSPATAHMYITNPLNGNGLVHLFSTHPPIQERIRRLNQMSPW